jgi:hypothetical protein
LWGLEWREFNLLSSKLNIDAGNQPQGNHGQCYPAVPGKPWDDLLPGEKLHPGCPGDAMCFLTDGAIGFEPIVVEGCWDVIPKALRMDSMDVLERFAAEGCHGENFFSSPNLRVAHT